MSLCLAVLLLLPLALGANERETFQLPPPEPYTPSVADPVDEPWRWTRFPELAGTGVECVTQTTDGAMWFGVDDGVIRYDGLQWARYGADDGIHGDKVWSLVSGNNGDLYAGTEFGISHFDGQSWQRLFPPAGDVPWSTYDLELVDGDLWAATGMGALRLRDDDGAVLYTAGEPDPALFGMMPYVEMRLLPAAARPSIAWNWMHERSLGLFVSDSEFTHGELPRYVVDIATDGPAARAGIRVGDRIMGDGPDEPGASVDVSLSVIRPGLADTLIFDLSLAVFDDDPALFLVSDILPGDGGLWISAGAGPVLFFDPDESSDPVSAQLYDLDGYASVLARTADGAIWAATQQAEKPLYRIAAGEVATFSTDAMGWPGNDTYASALTTADGALWLGQHEGVLRVLRNNQWYTYTRLPTPFARITDLHETDDGFLWVVVRGSEALRLDLSARYATYEDLWFLGESRKGTHLAEARYGSDFFGRFGPALVRRQGDEWSRQPWPQGLLSRTSLLGVSPSALPWAAGSVDSVAATVVVDDAMVTRVLHPELSYLMSPIAGFEATNGDLWFASHVNSSNHGYTGGSLRFDGQRWWHLHSPGAPASPYGFAELPNGDIVTTGDRLRRYDGQTWSQVEAPAEVNKRYSQSTIVDRHGALWVETRAYGVFRCLDGEWTRFTPQNGLPAPQVYLFLGPDGEAWGDVRRRGGNTAGIVRFDGDSWVPALPKAMAVGEARYDWGGVSNDGAYWLQRLAFEADSLLSTAAIRIAADDRPPETSITVAAREISQPGNTVVSWTGADPWRDTPPEEIRFSWRLDGGDWSPYTTATTHTFLELASGDHTIEVRARDRDLNADPTPAVAHVGVVPPVWQQAWFLSLIGGLLIAIAVQTTRVLRRERRLSSQNRQLTLERAAESVRAEAMDMRSAEDIRRVVGVVRRELIGLGFDERRPTTINYPDPDDGDRLLTYFAIPNPRRFGMSWTSPDLWELDDQSVAALFTYDTGARVRDAIAHGRIERLDQPGTAASVALLMQNLYGVDPAYMAHVDIGPLQTSVPFDQGQLCLRGDDYLTQDEIDILRALCDALSLGFTRYEDFRQLEQASTNKSQFLRRMSHDLRSPMNAIIGYTRVVLRRARAVLDERQVRNLENIETSSTNLLSLINDILDLSRIEAGRTELNLQAVEVARLADECADALEPIVQQGVQLRRQLVDVGSVDTDPDRLRQIVMNLLGNAAKFTEAGSITLSLRKDGDTVVLSVADTGIGIPAADLPYIFDEFRQVERQGGEGAEGTGLGLAIARKTVELLGGEISATSEVGEGTTFTVRLPA